MGIFDNIKNTIKNSFKLYMYTMIFGFVRLFILCILENQLVDTDDIMVSIVFFIFVIIFITFIDYNYSSCTDSLPDSLLNAMYVNAIGVSSSEIIMFILPTILQIIPYLNIVVDFILMGVPYVGTIITGLIWILTVATCNVILSLTCSFKFLKYFKIIGLIVITIFNFIFDKINFMKAIRKKTLKTLMKEIKKPKFRKKLIKKNRDYLKNNAWDYVENNAWDYYQNQQNNYPNNYYYQQDNYY